MDCNDEKTREARTIKNRTQDTDIKPRILAPTIVARMIGLSRVTIWRMCRRGQFPKPIAISPGRVGFIAEDIEDWIDSKRERGDCRETL